LSNSSSFFVGKARVVSEPKVFGEGDKALTTVRVAINTYGDKAKERYEESYFVDLKFGSRQGGRAQELKVGDMVSGNMGPLMIRTYDDKHGERRLAYECPYVNSFEVFPKEPRAAAEATERMSDPAPSEPTKPRTNPFAKK
jgi:hypothetical protein